MIPTVHLALNADHLAVANTSPSARWRTDAAVVSAERTDRSSRLRENLAPKKMQEASIKRSKPLPNPYRQP